jgi:hypothetical protein
MSWNFTENGRDNTKQIARLPIFDRNWEPGGDIASFVRALPVGGAAMEDSGECVSRSSGETRRPFAPRMMEMSRPSAEDARRRVALRTAMERSAHRFLGIRWWVDAWKFREFFLDFL